MNEYRLMTDEDIKEACLWETPMITDFLGTRLRNHVSSGISCIGYDARLKAQKSHFLHPKEFILIETVEKFNMPYNVAGFTYQKSTYARHGIITQTGVLEPGWSGSLNVGLFNAGSETIELFPNEGIIQICFFLTKHPEAHYAQLAGKYQNQEGITKGIKG